MKKRLYDLIREVGGDPNDPIWRWLVLNGPHGPDFTWGQSRHEPPGYVGVEHLEKIIAERYSEGEKYLAAIRNVTAAAFQSQDAELVRRAIQVTAVVGNAEDLKRVAEFISHADTAVSADARAATFYLKQKSRRQ